MISITWRKHTKPCWLMLRNRATETVFFGAKTWKIGKEKNGERYHNPSTLLFFLPLFLVLCIFFLHEPPLITG